MKNWESALIPPENTAWQALTRLEGLHVEMLLAVDKHGILVGTLTNSDIRRGMLVGTSLNAPLSKFMRTQPVCVEVGAKDAEVSALYAQHQVSHLPVLDSRGRVSSLRTHSDYFGRRSRKYDNLVFLMAGGSGKRMRPLTDNCPKPLLAIKNKPILEHILERFIETGFHRFYISTHYMGSHIHDHFGDGSAWNATIEYVHEKQPLGTVGALGMLPHEEIDQPLILMNGDLLTTVNFQQLLTFHETNEADATVCTREYKHEIPFGVVTSHAADPHQMVDIVEKPTEKSLISAGIYVFNPEVIKSVSKGKRLDIPDLLKQQLERGRAIKLFPLYESWRDIGSDGDIIDLSG